MIAAVPLVVVLAGELATAGIRRSFCTILSSVSKVIHPVGTRAEQDSILQSFGLVSGTGLRQEAQTYLVRCRPCGCGDGRATAVVLTSRVGLPFARTH